MRHLLLVIFTITLGLSETTAMARTVGDKCEELKRELHWAHFNRNTAENFLEDTQNQIEEFEAIDSPDKFELEMLLRLYNDQRIFRRALEDYTNKILQLEVKITLACRARASRRSITSMPIGY